MIIPTSTKQLVYAMMEKFTVKMLLHLLKVSGGFASFLVTTLVSEAFDSIIIPLLNKLIIQGHLYYDVKKGKILVKKKDEAKEGGSDAEYDSAVDDILS